MSSTHDEAIGQFCGVTGADEERAKNLLEACDWNLELAINMHVDTDDGRADNRAGSSRSMGAGPSTSNASPQVVNLDDDSIEEVSNDSPPSRLDKARRGARQTASHRPSGQPDWGDDVRPPIPPVRQVLVQDTDYGTLTDLIGNRSRYNTRGPSGSSSVYDAFRDFQAEANWQESVAQDGESTTSDKKTSLTDLFRPPLELIFRGSLASAREAGSLKNKWLLVNIQNGKEFACQILNRDVWSNQTVKDIVKEHFIFWQVYNDSSEGSRYANYYQAYRLPHVAIIDPRTGELVRSWPPTIDHNSFCDSVMEFLSENPSPDGTRVKEDDSQQQPQQQKLHEQELDQILPKAATSSSSSSSSFAAAAAAVTAAEPNPDTFKVDPTPVPLEPQADDDPIVLDDSSLEMEPEADEQLAETKPALDPRAAMRAAAAAAAERRAAAQQHQPQP